MPREGLANSFAAKSRSVAAIGTLARPERGTHLLQFRPDRGLSQGSLEIIERAAQADHLRGKVDVHRGIHKSIAKQPISRSTDRNIECGALGHDVLGVYLQLLDASVGSDHDFFVGRRHDAERHLVTDPFALPFVVETV